MAQIEAHARVGSSSPRHFLSRFESRRRADLKALASIADELSVAKGVQAMAEGDPKYSVCCSIRGLVDASRLCHFGVEFLPALPSSVIRLHRLLNNSVIDLRELVRVVWSDPSIAAKVLHRAMLENRGEFPTRVESVLLVGVQTLTELIKGTPVVLPTDSDAISVTALLRHSRVVSLLSERFALARGGCSEDQAAILGLLHHVEDIRNHYAGVFSRADGNASDRNLLQIVRTADYVANIIGVGVDSDQVRCGTHHANLFSGDSTSGLFPSGHSNYLERENIWAFVH